MTTNKPVPTIAANLRHAARNHETVTIGGGEFGPAELLEAANLIDPEVARRREDPTPEMHAAVRKVLQHHGLAAVGDGVVEADLIHAVLSNHDEADTIEWLEKGNAEWRDTARLAMKHQNMASATARVAISHLHALLNSRRTATQAWEAERAAREWLESIGSEVP
jgi:hypothetical protein